MRNVLLVLASVSVLARPALAGGEGPQVGVDPRVELMSILFRLAGNNEYLQGRVPAYNAAIERHFGEFRNHEAVELARLGRRMGGIAYDAPMSMAVHLSDVESLAERVPFDQSDIKLDARWRGASSRVFLEAARRFVADTNFAEFLKSQQALSESANGRIRSLVESEFDVAWFDKFFGSRAGSRFFAVPGMANGSSSYGPAFRSADGAEESYAIIGVWLVDGEGLPVFPRGLARTLVHEFTHSYTNPLIDCFYPQMEEAAARIFEAVKGPMRAQAYSDPKVVLYESLVRASTARYTLARDGPEAAAAAVRYEQSKAFYWTGELFGLLGRYEDDRERCPNLESFMPEVVNYFNDLSWRVGDLVPH